MGFWKSCAVASKLADISRAKEAARKDLVEIIRWRHRHESKLSLKALQHLDHATRHLHFVYEEIEAHYDERYEEVSKIPH